MLFYYVFSFSWIYSSQWTKRRYLNARWIVGLGHIFIYSSEKELFDSRTKFWFSWLQICSWQHSNCIKDSWTSHLFNWPNKIETFRQSGQKRLLGAHTPVQPLLGKSNTSLWKSNPFNMITKWFEELSSTFSWHKEANKPDLSYKC